jgi:predicted nicotinamide N-methyase
MSKIEEVYFPRLGLIQLLIQSKQDIRLHAQYGDLGDELNEWFYWNRVWASEVALSEFIIQEYSPSGLFNQSILELGCGTGLAGMVCAKLGGVPTFSDKVPMVIESIKKTCCLNGISAYHTEILDWSIPHGVGKSFDLVLGGEIFYDSTFLEDICQLLRGLLNEGGTGLFCDPGRLGIAALEACFLKHFSISVKDAEVEWPRHPIKKRNKHSVLLYELVKRPSLLKPQ